MSEGGAASQAGIRKGDVILSVDGVELNEAATLQEQIGKHRPNDKVKLMIKRSGSMKQIEVTLRNKAGKTELLTRDDVDVMEVLGVADWRSEAVWKCWQSRRTVFCRRHG